MIKENKNNPSGLWKTLNELTSRNTHSSAPTSIISDGVETKNSQSISSLFNTFFTSIGKTLANTIKQRLSSNIFSCIQLPQFNSTFEFKEIDVASVFKQLSTLQTNKSTGFDGISDRLLKDAAAIIAPTLTIFNQSLKSSIFPKIWKDGKVTLIFKSGDRSNMSNYIPITVLPILSKILNVSFTRRFTAIYLKTKSSHNLNLALDQSYLRVPHWHFSPILFLIMLITASVFLDFSKAFDTVDHAILLCKLKSFGLDNNSLNWFESYLTNRQQKTSINNTLSSSLPVSVGVPQGSILGPLLFIIYINDMPNFVKHCKIILYADDTLLYYSSNSIKDIELCVNEDIHSICKWLDENLLTLNCAKSKFLLFGGNRRYQYRHIR